MKARIMNTACSLAIVILSLLVPSRIGFAADPTVDEILDRALERARWSEKQGLEANFAMDLQKISEKLDSSGAVKKREKRGYRVTPIEGVPFERLVSRNERPLSPSEVEKEEQREAEFARKAANGDLKKRREEERVVFDEELVNRYVWTLEGEEDVAGRPAMVLSFVPREGRLPVRKRMDYALNKAEGKIWIDSELFEVARVEFELKEKVRLWWGLIGTISDLRGRVERKPVSQQAWLPSRVQIYLKGRILFSTLHQREDLYWSNFTRAGNEVSAAAQ